MAINKMYLIRNLFTINLIIFFLCPLAINAQLAPSKINFVRQGVKRLVFDDTQAITLAKLDFNSSVGFSLMYPVNHHQAEEASITIIDEKLQIESENVSETSIWFGGFNPFATYSLDIDKAIGGGFVGFEFSDTSAQERFIVELEFQDSVIRDARLKVILDNQIIIDESIAVNLNDTDRIVGKVILQMLGSGFTLFHQNGNELPKVIGQSDFNKIIDLREKKYINSFSSKLYNRMNTGSVQVHNIEMSLSTGIGLADIRAITYENGDPFLDNGRLWYTMSIRGRALPHHIQGVFSMNPSVFDLKLEGIIVFDRNDGLLRNEIASHLFYDRQSEVWRGITTGFSAYANLDKEKKQLLAIESKRDPRFGFSIMKAEPFGMVGDYEDPHIIFDEQEDKWRMLACENQDGYKAVLFESDYWNRNYTAIAGPVEHNSTGTSIQKIGEERYCFSGSSEREIYVYSYPELNEVGTLKMNLPPWDTSSGTRVWPNVVQLPDSYPFKFVALMMDRLNYPGQQGPQWSYGGIYLYHGFYKE